MALAVAFLPFYLNDFFYLGELSGLGFLLVDYATRLISLCGFAAAVRWGGLPRLPQRNLMLCLLVVLGAAVLVRLQQTQIYPIIREHLDFFRLKFPLEPLNAPLALLDLSLGLIVVAVSEELVFRRLMFSLLRQYHLSVFIFLSSVAFSLIHWSGGLAEIINTFVAGCIFAIVYAYTKRILFLFVLHYIANFPIFYEYYFS